MPDEKTFEQLNQELEEAVRRLEGGDLSLDESLALFARSSELAAQCNDLLDRAELRVRMLTERPDGSTEATPLEGWQNS